MEISEVFDWNPPVLSPAAPSCAEVVLPSSFYHFHLDERLSLKRIITTSSLVSNLSKTVDRTLKEIKDHGIVLTPLGEDDLFPTPIELQLRVYKEPIIDASSVAASYQRTTALYCKLIASMLFISPKSPIWETILLWRQFEDSAVANPGLDESYALQMLEEDDDSALKAPDDLWKSIDDDTRLTLRRAAKKYPILALWEVLAITPENEACLKAAGEPPVQNLHFEDSPNVVAAPLSTVPLHVPDATILSWGRPISSLVGDPNLGVLSSGDPKRPSRRSSRIQKPHASIKVTTPSTTQKTQKRYRQQDDLYAITLPSRPSPRAEAERSFSKSLLKHAWFRAVHNDSTFVIFNCGNFERIAFRHRGSQNLYLSDLIHIPNCKDPGYAKLHIGLYMSIMHDVLERTRHIYEHTNTAQGKKRRRGEEVSAMSFKRPKTRAVVAKLLADKVEHESLCDYLTNDATRCNLLLLRMCYGIYNSPSPSYLLRADRPLDEKISYEPHQYLSVTLTSNIASGATGVVHGAMLKFLSDGGKTHNMPVIVKFSMKAPQKKKLRHEYSIYERLASSHIQGIPRMLGLFEDHDSDTLALVMTHTGTSLVTLHREKDKIVVEEPQRSPFIHVMTDIHRAGVRHRDIRPENLTIDDKGRVFIIDFDMAEISPTEGARSRELIHLTELLDGDYYPPHEFPSDRTPPVPVWGGSRTNSRTSTHLDSQSSTAS